MLCKKDVAGDRKPQADARLAAGPLLGTNMVGAADPKKGTVSGRHPNTLSRLAADQATPTFSAVQGSAGYFSIFKEGGVGFTNIAVRKPSNQQL